MLLSQPPNAQKLLAEKGEELRQLAERVGRMKSRRGVGAPVGGNT